MLEYIRQLLLNNPYMTYDEEIKLVSVQNEFTISITTNKRTYDYRNEY